MLHKWNYHLSELNALLTLILIHLNTIIQTHICYVCVYMHNSHMEALLNSNQPRIQHNITAGDLKIHELRSKWYQQCECWAKIVVQTNWYQMYHTNIQHILTCYANIKHRWAYLCIVKESSGLWYKSSNKTEPVNINHRGLFRFNIEVSMTLNTRI